ncbi:NUDIX hydrolase [Actinomadura xylanilytica]|uniref:NUDIX hydrolase n=1 Tax=Actinomadura xylanilytica TaxID=887459 RepID=UPI00255B2C2C|nr:NUDIX domain-containing protein [Actinomadura xylanilytica]MDL4773191.1 NUDIX domain-containing protein [Actinomadura xylanilytica]
MADPPPPRAPDTIVRAAGAVLWRDGARGPEVALVHRPRYDDWSFPKGKLVQDEHVVLAAVREVEEETGVPTRLGRRLPTSTYPKDDRLKRVDYWSARGAVTAGPAFTPNSEVDELAWLPVPDAAGRLTYPHDAGLLRAFAAGPLRTRPLVIVRHGSAGEKAWWGDADELRPLDERGRTEASGLAAVLAAFGPARVISSATVRCLGTVLPYARLIRAGVVADRAFTIGETAPDRARARLLDLVADGAPALVCTHGEIVAELVTALCGQSGEEVPEDPGLRKGEFWVAHLAFEDGRVAALERHAPPAAL